MDTCIKKIKLPNGLLVSIVDGTRRYYEDYHLVRLEVVCEVPVRSEYFDMVEEYEEARKLLGDSVDYCRTLEKMGVPYLEIGAAKEELVRGFEDNASKYVGSSVFPRKLVLSELAKVRDKNLKRIA